MNKVVTVIFHYSFILICFLKKTKKPSEITDSLKLFLKQIFVSSRYKI